MDIVHVCHIMPTSDLVLSISMQMMLSTCISASYLSSVSLLTIILLLKLKIIYIYLLICFNSSDFPYEEEFDFVYLLLLQLAPSSQAMKYCLNIIHLGSQKPT